MKRVLVLGLFAVAASSQAITFDWESLTSGVYASVSETVEGLTATATGNPGTIEVLSIPTFGLAVIGGPFDNQNSTWHPVRIDFSSIINNVSIETGDGGAGDDDGTLILEAWDSGNNLVGSDTLVYGVNTSNVTLSVVANNISYITFRTQGAQLPGSMAINNVTVAVPEPFTMALMGGAALAGYRRMRRKRA